MHKLYYSLLAFIVLTLAPAAFAEPAEYTLTRQYGSVLFRVLQEQYIDLVGRFDNYSGSLVFDPDNLAATRLQATVNMASVNTGDKDVAELLISSSSWFNTSEFPEAVFTTSQAELLDSGKVALSGELTFLGISRPWTLEATFRGGSDGSLEGDALGMSATGSFQRSDFGLRQYMNVAADRVNLEVNVKFRRN